MAGRRRLVEPEIDDDHTDPADGPASTLLTPAPDRFLTAPARLAASPLRRGRPGAVRCRPWPGDPRYPRLGQLRRNLVRDLAALNKIEMLLWGGLGCAGLAHRTGPGELSVLDELATLTGQPSPPLADLQSAHRRPEFVVPDTVTSYSPARTDVPAVVDVSAVARTAPDRRFGKADVSATRWHRTLTLGTRWASTATCCSQWVNSAGRNPQMAQAAPVSNCSPSIWR